MKHLAVLWTTAGKPMCLVDSADPHGLRLEAHLDMLQRSFPESGARMGFVDVTECSDATAETLRPPPEDPFSPTAINRELGRAELATLTEEEVKRG